MSSLVDLPNGDRVALSAKAAEQRSLRSLEAGRPAGNARSRKDNEQTDGDRIIGESTWVAGIVPEAGCSAFEEPVSRLGNSHA